MYLIKMKTKLLIIIIAIVVLSALSYVIIYQQSPSQFILCDAKYDLIDGNCVKKASFNDPDYSIDSQKMVYENMNCDDLLNKVYDEKISIDSKEIRNIVRDKLRECNSLIDNVLRHGDCSSIKIIAQAPVTFYFEDQLIDLQHTITKCVRDNEFKLTDITLTHQVGICQNDRYETRNYVVEACKDVQVISQPFRHSISIEEIYPEIINNEREIITQSGCTSVINTYDGKMHLIHWGVHKKIIADYMEECKS